MTSSPVPFRDRPRGSDTERNLGEKLQIAESLLASQTTSTTFQTKLVLSAAGRALPAKVPNAGYILAWSYGWNHNATGNDFEGRILVDGAAINPATGFEYMLHRQEPKDSAGGAYPPGSGSGTNQAYVAAGELFLTLDRGPHTFTLQFRTGNGGIASTIWNARMRFWRWG